MRYHDLERPIFSIRFANSSPAGNGSARYRSWDREPLPGLNYYRLKMADLDGTFAYSHIVTAEFKAQPVVQWTVYPNPTQGKLYLEITNALPTGGTAEIFNGGARSWRGSFSPVPTSRSTPISYAPASTCSKCITADRSCGGKGIDGVNALWKPCYINAL